MKTTATAEEQVESIISGHSCIESSDEAGDPESQEEKESQVTGNKEADAAAVQADCEIGDTEDTTSDLATIEKEEKLNKKRKGTSQDYFTRSRGNPLPFSKKLCRGDSLF